MKKSLTLLLFVWGAVALSAKERVIDNPQFSASMQSNVVVEKIVLDDNATSLYMVIWHSPSSWIRIDSKTYIRANGEKYMLESAEGIEPDKEVYSDKTNKTRFVLKFPAIDPQAETLDFIETDCESCFKIFGLNLDPHATFVASDIPEYIKDLADVKESGESLEPPVLDAGIATLKGMFLGYAPGMNIRIEAYVNNPVTGIQEELGTKVNDDGSFELPVPLVTTMEVLLRFPRYNKFVLLSPRQESVLYIDLHQKSYQDTRNEALRIPASRYLFWGGANAAVNNQMEDANMSQLLNKKFYSNEVFAAILGMTAEQYKAYMMQQMDDVLKTVAGMRLTEKAKELAVLTVKNNVMYHLFFADYILKDAFRRSHKLNFEDELEGFEKLEFDAGYYSFLKELDINNPLNLYSGSYSSNLNSAGYMQFVSPAAVRPDPRKYTKEELAAYENHRLNENKGRLAQVLGTTGGIAFDLLTTQAACRKSGELMPLTGYDMEELDKLENPFYLEYAVEKNKKLLAELERTKGKANYTIHDTPSSKGEELFTDIVKAFEGKVILVDFWATWCGPCRMAMKQFEAAKTELKEKGVIFIYLTDESSPQQAWENMIQSISGEHYRMTFAQFDELKQKFGAKGVPSYLILNKKGEQVYFSIGFEGAEKLSNLLNDELNK